MLLNFGAMAWIDLQADIFEAPIYSTLFPNDKDLRMKRKIAVKLSLSSYISRG
jgi:hypothetical protein